MFSKPSSFLLSAAAMAAGVLVAGAGNAQATVIYSQTFNSSTSALTGTQPTVDTGSATWAAPFGASFAQNGTIQYQGVSALPFTPVTGNTYTLSGEISSTAAAGNSGYWAGIGFWNTWPSSSDAPIATLTAGGQLAFYATDYAASGGGTNVATFSTTLSSLNVTMVLNTSAPQWTVSYSADGGLYTANYTYAAGSNPTNIPGVMLVQGSNNSGAGIPGWPVQASAFELQVSSVPEPATLLFMGLGGLGLLLFKRKGKAPA